MVFHNGSIYDYHFIVKELAKELEKKLNFPGKTTEKYKIFSVPITKEVRRIGRTKNKLQKPYLTNYNLSIAQDLWQADYQALLMILLKKIT